MNDRQEAAHAYLDSGLPITLCVGKKPMGTDWPNREWTHPQIDRAYRANPQLNVGVILGPRSGLIDFDADGPGANEVLIDLFGTDPPVAPTFSSTRGSHRLISWHPKLEAVAKASLHFGDLEVRIGANGRAAQTIFPPSEVDGVTRVWKVPLDDCEPPKLSQTCLNRLIKAGAKGKPEGRQHSRHSRHSRHSKHRLHVSSVSSVSSVLPVSEAIELAIQRTLPSGNGFRHRCLFKFARELKAIPSLQDADLSALKPVVFQWYEHALPKIGTQDFEESWADFGNAWVNVLHPVGEEKIRMIYEKSLTHLPAAAENYQGDSIRRLVGLCHELQRTAGDKPFYLDCRTAGALIGINHVLANKYLNLLVRERVLELVMRGARNRASEYRYIGD